MTALKHSRKQQKNQKSLAAKTEKKCSSRCSRVYTFSLFVPGHSFRRRKRSSVKNCSFALLAVDLQFNWSDRAHYNFNSFLNSLRCSRFSSSQIDQHIWMKSNDKKKTQKKKTLRLRSHFIRMKQERLVEQLIDVSIKTHVQQDSLHLFIACWCINSDI